MSMVFLHCLFEEDKNFHGLLNPLLNKKVTIEVGDCEYINEKFLKEFEKDYPEPVILKDLFKDPNIDYYEWHLDNNGILKQTIAATIGGEFKILNLFKIDIKQLMLDNISKNDLLKIGELVCWKWFIEDDSPEDFYKFKYSHHLSSSHVVDKKKFDQFKENFNL
jgi:hypothetical protein